MKTLLWLSFWAFSVQASIVDAVYLQGVVTNNYKNSTYVSVRDSFEQEYVLPKKLIEKKTGRKLSSSPNGLIFFFQISSNEYQELYKNCVGDKEINLKKLCPPSL